MKRNAILATLLALVSLACASAPKIKVGWDQHADFKKYKTWAWKPDGSIKDPVWEKRFRDVLSDQLDKDGLKQRRDRCEPRSLGGRSCATLGRDPGRLLRSRLGLRLGGLGPELHGGLPDPGRHDSRRPRGREGQGGGLAGQGERLHRDGPDQRAARREADRDHRRDVRRVPARDDPGEVRGSSPLPPAARVEKRQPGAGGEGRAEGGPAGLIETPGSPLPRAWIPPRSARRSLLPGACLRWSGRWAAPAGRGGQHRPTRSLTGSRRRARDKRPPAPRPRHRLVRARGRGAGPLPVQRRSRPRRRAAGCGSDATGRPRPCAPSRAARPRRRGRAGTAGAGRAATRSVRLLAHEALDRRGVGAVQRQRIGGRRRVRGLPAVQAERLGRAQGRGGSSPTSMTRSSVSCAIRR